MGFFGNSFFWFAEGILACLAIIALRTWTQDKGIPMPFWKWPAIIAWTAFLGISVAYVGTSIGEGEMDAAFFGAVCGAVAASISGVVVWRLLGTR
jgi:hypothetical protein